MSSLTGDVAELVCSVRGKPTPEVQWRKAGGLVQALSVSVRMLTMLMMKSIAIITKLAALVWPNSG